MIMYVATKEANLSLHLQTLSFYINLVLFYNLQFDMRMLKL
jgi:hypothetical protein